jgi:hypothetical protein
VKAIGLRPGGNRTADGLQQPTLRAIDRNLGQRAALVIAADRRSSC